MNAHSQQTVKSNPLDLSGASGYEQSRRQVSSVIVSEQLLGDVPQSGGVRYVEVPVVEEVIRHVPKREVIEVEKVVPRYEVEWVEQEVSVPQVIYVDKPVERTQIQEVVRTVPRRTVQEVPREVIRTVPRVEYVQVEKIVQGPEQIIEVPKPVTVERPIHVKRRTEQKVPVVVAQTIRPVITESPDVVDVDVYEYEPEVIPVDVHVPKPVNSHLIAVGATDEVHHEVMVPVAQYNTLLKQLNPHLNAEDARELPYLLDDPNGPVPFLNPRETPSLVQMAPNAKMGVPTQLKSRGLTTTAGTVFENRPVYALQQQPQQQLQPQQQQHHYPQQQQQPLMGVPAYPAGYATSPRAVEVRNRDLDDLYNRCLQAYAGNPAMENQVRDVMTKYRDEPQQAIPLLQQLLDMAEPAPSQSRLNTTQNSLAPQAVHHSPQQVPAYYPTVRQRELSDRRGGTTQGSEEAKRMLNEAQALIRQANARMAQPQQQQVHPPHQQQQMHPQQQQMHPQLMMPPQQMQQQPYNPQQMMPMTTSRGIPTTRSQNSRNSRASGRRFDQPTSRYSPSSQQQQKRRAGCQC